MGNLFSKKKSHTNQDFGNDLGLVYDEFDKQMEILRQRVEQGKKYGEFTGVIMEGDKKMSSICYPTANVECDLKIRNGFYLSYISFDKKIYNGITFINSEEKISETYILSFNGNIYGKKVKIKILKFLSTLNITDNNVNLKQQFDKNIELAKANFLEQYI